MQRCNGGTWYNYPYLDLADFNKNVEDTTSVQSSAGLSMNLYVRGVNHP
jgi:hypothetical protein